MRGCTACLVALVCTTCALAVSAQRRTMSLGSARGGVPRAVAMAWPASRSGAHAVRGFRTHPFTGFAPTSRVFGHYARVRRHFGFGRFNGGIANCLGLGLDFQYCRTHVIRLDSAFYAYPFWGAYGYYSPYYDSAGGDAYQESEVRRLAAQVDQLNAELARMREEQALREYERELARAQEDAAHRSRSSASTGTVTPAQQPAIPTTLIFRDGKHQDVQNYAVVGKTLWIFNDERAHKVPLDALDLDATRKANELKGSQFPQ